MRFCECNRSHLDPVHGSLGGMLLCSLCNGFLMCDFCKDADLDSPFMSIAHYVIADSYACWHRAWMGVAKSPDVNILS